MFLLVGQISEIKRHEFQAVIGLYTVFYSTICTAPYVLRYTYCAIRTASYVLHLLQILEDYSEQHGTTRLVMFEDALEHLTRIHRILRMEQGHALLVGLGGGGKQSLTKVCKWLD